MKPPKSEFNNVYNKIKDLLEKSRATAFRAVNTILVNTYWEIGRIIVEEEQRGKERADYGSYLIVELSKKLTEEYGRGFNDHSLRAIRQFYCIFPIRSAVRSELTWTHYRQIMRLDDERARSFYVNESINNNWSTRELERQMNSLLFERLTLSKDKKKVLELSQKGQIIEKPEDLVKDPYVLEFLGIKEDNTYLEKDIEKQLIDKLKTFLLELGKGFSFVARQKRITVGEDNYYIDLVFYNYFLKCFVLIELKSGKLTHQDIGQMDFYVRYFEEELKPKGDNQTVGIILCSSKNEVMAKYTLLNDSRNIFASKYRLYLPTEEELKKELQEQIRRSKEG